LTFRNFKKLLLLGKNSTSLFIGEILISSLICSTFCLKSLKIC